MKRQLAFHRPPFFIPFFLSGPHLGTYHFWVEGFQREGAPSKTVETPWINATPLGRIYLALPRFPIKARTISQGTLREESTQSGFRFRFVFLGYHSKLSSELSQLCGSPYLARSK